MPRVVAVDLVISREYNFKSSRENLCVYPMVRLCKKEIGVKVIVSY